MRVLAAGAEGAPAMTPDRFREIMGADVAGLSDSEVERMIRALDGLADIVCELTLTRPDAKEEAS